VGSDRPMVTNALRLHKLTSISPGPETLVFTNTRGRALSPHNFFTNVWRPLLKTCGLDYEFHSLRHAAASLFIETLQWSPKRIQAVMGHSSITMTFDRYGHLFENKEDDQVAMKRLEAAVVAS
jgi:integrase